LPFEYFENNSVTGSTYSFKVFTDNTVHFGLELMLISL